MQERLRRRDIQDADNNVLKGISKSFIKYKQSIKNPTDDELKFHDFVHLAVKRREETRIKKMKDKKEQEQKELEQAKVKESGEIA